MSNNPYLKFGDQGPEVARLAELLKSRGCVARPPITCSSPKFGRAIENLVLYFQMTHQNSKRKQLDVDGKVGPITWWALEHSNGKAQRSFLEAIIPAGITGKRGELLETAIMEHGIKEDPGKPENRGKEVEKYLRNR